MINSDLYFDLTPDQIAKDYQNRCLTAQGLVNSVLGLRNADGSRAVEYEDLKKYCLNLRLQERVYYQAIHKLNESGRLPTDFPLPATNNPEQQVRDRLQQQLGGEVEVSTAAGRIDLLTNTELIEVKKFDDWKSALGQVLAYFQFFPKHQKRLHLFYDKPKRSQQLQQVEKICSDLDVAVTFEEVKP